MRNLQRIDCATANCITGQCTLLVFVLMAASCEAILLVRGSRIGVRDARRAIRLRVGELIVVLLVWVRRLRVRFRSILLCPLYRCRVGRKRLCFFVELLRVGVLFRLPADTVSSPPRGIEPGQASCPVLASPAEPESVQESSRTMQKPDPFSVLW